MEKLVQSLGRGSIILVSNNPKSRNNYEQKGSRPWLIVSEAELNKCGPFVWALPFTSTRREYPLAFDWTTNGPHTRTQGVLLCDQLAALDVDHRSYRLLERTTVPAAVDNLIMAILGFR